LLSYSSRQHTEVIFYAIVIVAGFLYVGLNPQYRTGAFNDDAAYVIAAANFWNSSSLPWTDLSTARPDFPFPGLPLLLAPIVKLIEPHWVFAEWMSIAVTLISIFLFARLLKNWLPPTEALVVLALYALNPIVGKYSGVLMPALYFITAALASFLLLDELLRKPSSIKAWGLGFVVTWGSLIRPEGIFLLFGITTALAIAKSWKFLGRFLVAPCLGWFFFILHGMHGMHSSETEYGGDLSALLTYWPHHVKELIQFLGHMIIVLCVNTVLAIRVPEGEWTTGAAALGALFCLWLARVGFTGIWNERRVSRHLLLGLLIFLGCYFAVHVLWHIAIPRYCVVLLPFMLIFIFFGVERLAVPSMARKIIKGLLISIFFVSYLYRDVSALHQSLWAPNPLNAPPWRSVEWIRQNTPASAHILSPIAPNIVLYAQRPALSLIKADNAEDFLFILVHMHLTYIVDRPVRALSPVDAGAEDPNKKWECIRRWMALSPKRYPILFSDPHEKITIYGVSPESGFIHAYENYLTSVKALQEGDLNGAMQILKKSVIDFPNLGTTHNALGVTHYLAHENLKEAERVFLHAIVILPDYPVAMLNLACLYHAMGQTEKSLLYVNRGLIASQANGQEAEFIQRVRMTHEQNEIDLPPNFPRLYK